jgi:hypothetical protein
VFEKAGGFNLASVVTPPFAATDKSAFHPAGSRRHVADRIAPSALAPSCAYGALATTGVILVVTDGVLLAINTALPGPDGALPARNAAFLGPDGALPARNAAFLGPDGALHARNAVLLGRNGALQANNAVLLASKGAIQGAKMTKNAVFILPPTANGQKATVLGRFALPSAPSARPICRPCPIHIPKLRLGAASSEDAAPLGLT